MADEILFAGELTPDPANAAPTTVSIPDNVKDLIGEGKKYATLEKALEALGHSQAHIAKIEADNAELRAKADKAVDSETLYATVQEVLKNSRPTSGDSLDAAALEGLLDRKLTEREQKKLETSNAVQVEQALIGKFGDKDKAKQVFEDKAKELGIGVEFLTSLAKKSPKAVLELFGTKAAPTPGSTRTTVNSEQLSTQHRDPPRKSVMGGATSAELLEAWRAAAPKTS